MKVLVCPNSMKGSLSAIDFANAVIEGLKFSGITEIEKNPVADGGDGTAEILAHSLNAQFVACKVNDPLGRDIESGFYLTSNNIAIIEMASASGLRLLNPNEYSAFYSSSFGTGQLIRDAVEKGAKKILLGVGGSATVDGGMGALMALGVKFFSSKEMLTQGNGLTMGEVVDIQVDNASQLLTGVQIIILTDVINPLLGADGAVPVFAPQKGIARDKVHGLERNLSLFAGAVFQSTGKDISKMKSGGAAGGIAASFHALLNAKIVDGASFILSETGFYSKVNSVDAIITGEGLFDETSLSGKVTGEIIRFGMEIDIPVFVICGKCNYRNQGLGIEVIELQNDFVDRAEAMRNAYSLIIEKSKMLGEKLKHYEQGN